MKILILYASIEGQTEKIARHVAREVRGTGHEDVLHDIGGTGPRPDFSGVDKVILAAPVHERRHPEGFEVSVAAYHDDLAARPTLMLSVSLNAAFREGMEEAQEYVVEMEMRTGFRPTEVALVAGAIRAHQYDYFAAQVVRHVVMRGRDYDPEAGEHEFTDWGALDATVKAFLNR